MRCPKCRWNASQEVYLQRSVHENSILSQMIRPIMPPLNYVGGTRLRYILGRRHFEYNMRDDEPSNQDFVGGGGGGERIVTRQ